MKTNTIGLIIGGAILAGSLLIPSSAAEMANEQPNWARFALVEAFPDHHGRKEYIYSATRPRTRGVTAVVTEGEKNTRTKVKYILAGRDWRVISVY